MKLRLISPGKTRPKWLKDAISDYIVRLSPYCKVDLIEVQDQPEQQLIKTVLEKEGEKILSRIGPNDLVWAFDLGGKKLDSIEFSRCLIDGFKDGKATLTLVVGGALGLSPAVLRRANLILCLSNMTFTHQMARLLVLEQCYRAFRIDRGEPYHK